MKLLKINFSLLLALSVLVAGFLTVGVYQAKAVGDAYFPQDTTVALDVGNFIIVGGSDADTVTASNTQITVTISTGQLLTIDSSDRRILSNDIGFSYSCSSDKSSIVINTTTTTKTVVITPSSSNCGSTGGGSGGGGGGGTTTTSTTTPTPTPTPTPTTTTVPTTPTPTPAVVSTSKPTPISRGFVSLTAFKLKDGDVISAGNSSDPDVYIVNSHGYKRLFLNPAIFAFYGHLGGFSKVKATVAPVRDTLVTSGLFRNCETNDKKVYGVETTAEDAGKLHWVNTTGEQAVKDDPAFFNKVFCINTKEFSWYPQGTAYTSVNQILDYSRKNTTSTPTPVPTPTPTPTVSTTKKYKVVNTDQLNVRSAAATSGAILGKLPLGQVIESLGQQGLWHKIKYQAKDGWVHSDYLKVI
ncbi:MAG: SH3 domain-containing protein [Patescibacteria group bacterium]